ncbi:MAG: hypothetical protein U0271_33965 [Polyangiaceae bacterium]
MGTTHVASSCNHWRWGVPPIALLSLLACGPASDPDPCRIDDYEEQQDLDGSADLGTLTDQADFAPLELTFDSPDDEDDFIFAAADLGIDGNPDIEIEARPYAAERLRVDLELRCKDGSLASIECNDTLQQPQGNLGACNVEFAASEVQPISLFVDYDCDGDPDDAFVSIHLSRIDPADACLAYRLSLTVK